MRKIIYYFLFYIFLILFAYSLMLPMTFVMQLMFAIWTIIFLKKLVDEAQKQEDLKNKKENEK